MATSVVDDRKDKRKEVMVGELPGDFLRVVPSPEQQQIASDQQAATAMQQQSSGFRSAGVMGRLSVTFVEAKLNKNYSITGMDPYVRIRAGHNVFETQTNYRGGKNPKWNKTIHCCLPYGMKSVCVEVFDECALRPDERIAWTNITVPEEVFKGEVIDDWYPLSGSQGEGKEGFINIVFSYNAQMPFSVSYIPSPMMVVSGSPYYSCMPGVMPYYAPAPGVAAVPYMAPAAQPTHGSQPPVHVSEDDIKQVQEMFPNLDKEVIQSVMTTNQGNKEKSINSLLAMSTEN